MTNKARIIELGQILAHFTSCHSDFKSPALHQAREWWRAGALSRYSNEDFDILQAMVSEVSNLKRNITFTDHTWQTRLEKAV